MAVYNIYVKKKETELIQKIKEMQESSNTKNKDDQITRLKSQCSKLMSEAQEQEKIKEKLREQIKSWKQKYDFEKQEHEFYHNHAMETKRKNKLLKVAVGRLQVEYDKLKQKYKIADSELQFVNQLTKQIERVQNAGGEEDDANTFNMTKFKKCFHV